MNDAQRERLRQYAADPKNEDEMKAVRCAALMTTSGRLFTIPSQRYLEADGNAFYILFGEHPSEY